VATISKASKKATPKKKVRHYNLFLGLAVNKIRIELISQFILLKSGEIPLICHMDQGNLTKKAR
jgi:hypothetical protein